jgi:hypothetical protein
VGAQPRTSGEVPATGRRPVPAIKNAREMALGICPRAKSNGHHGGRRTGVRRQHARRHARRHVADSNKLGMLAPTQADDSAGFLGRGRRPLVRRPGVAGGAGRG